MEAILPALPRLDVKRLIRKLRPDGSLVWLVLFIMWCLYLLRDLINWKLQTHFFVVWYGSHKWDPYSVGVDMLWVTITWLNYNRSRNQIK